jgi:hypothetical protein
MGGDEAGIAIRRRNTQIKFISIVKGICRKGYTGGGDMNKKRRPTRFLAEGRGRRLSPPLSSSPYQFPIGGLNKLQIQIRSLSVLLALLPPPPPGFILLLASSSSWLHPPPGFILQYIPSFSFLHYIPSSAPPSLACFIPYFSSSSSLHSLLLHIPFSSFFLHPFLNTAQWEIK